MSEELCSMEPSVLRAMRTGQWTVTQEGHIADCPSCQELLKVAGFMNRIAESLRRDPALPDPVLVWLKAQWIEREEKQQRYLARMAVRRALMQAVMALVLLLLVIGVWSADTSVDELIRYTLVGTFVLFLGGFFMISRWRGLLVS